VAGQPAARSASQVTPPVCSPDADRLCVVWSRRRFARRAGPREARRLQAGGWPYAPSEDGERGPW